MQCSSKLMRNLPEIAKGIMETKFPTSRISWLFSLHFYTTSVSRISRYRSLGHSASPESSASFFLLLDLMTFFDLFHAKKFDDAIETIDKINVSQLVTGSRFFRDLTSLYSAFRSFPFTRPRSILWSPISVSYKTRFGETFRTCSWPP